ncbi:MAG: hypothetical protein JW816_03060 [Candidatus Buchananbacteria bacterium]|nr:hypothetical protein [Candidatus Buchananbacteria bacterium]
MVREAAEELYFGSTSHPIWEYLSRLHKTGDTAELKNLFSPKRYGVVFDRANNSYCALFTINQPSELTLNPKTREIGEIKNLADLRPEQINPLTAWFLKHLQYTDLPLPNIQTGPIEHIYYLDDIYRHIQKGQNLKPSPLEEPGWLIDY